MYDPNIGYNYITEKLQEYVLDKLKKDHDCIPEKVDFTFNGDIASLTTFTKDSSEGKIWVRVNPSVKFTINPDTRCHFPGGKPIGTVYITVLFEGVPRRVSCKFPYDGQFRSDCKRNFVDPESGNFDIVGALESMFDSMFPYYEEWGTWTKTSKPSCEIMSVDLDGIDYDYIEENNK